MSETTERILTVHGIDVTADIHHIAKVCHEANRGYCQALGDDSQGAWEDTPSEIQRSVIAGVRQYFDNPDLTPEGSHQNWMDYKSAEGWVWGPRKDLKRKTHPCMVAYGALPPEQRAKDHIFRAIALTLLEEFGLVRPY